MSNNVGGIQFTVRVDVGNSARRLSDISRSLRKADQEAERLDAVLRRLIPSLEAIGAIKSTAVDLLNRRLVEIKKSSTAVTKAMEATAKAADKANRAHDKAGKAAQKHASDLEQLAQKSRLVADAIAAVGGAIASKYMLDGAKNSALLAARVDTLSVVMEQVGTSAGYSEGELANYEERLKALGITTQSARNAIAAMSRNQLDLAKSTELARIAQNAAVLANENSSETLTRIIRAIQSGETELLRTVGLQTNLTSVYKRAAAELGITSDQLTDAQKRQAFLNAVLNQGSAIAGVYEAAMGTVGKRLSSLPRLTEEASRAFGEQFQPTLAGVVSGIEIGAKAFSGLDRDTQAVIAAIATAATTGLATATALAGLRAAVAAVDLATKAATVSATGWTAVLMATPVGWIAGGLAGIAGAYALIAAQAENARREIEAVQAAGEARGAEQAAKLDDNGIVDRLRELRAELKQAQAEYDRELEDSISRRRAAGAFGGGAQDAAIESAERKVRSLKAEIDGLLAAKNMQRIRELDDELEKQNSAYRSALQVQSDLHKQRAKSMDDASAEILAQFRAYRDQLSQEVLSEAELIEYSKRTLDERKRQIEETYAIKTRDKGGAELAALEAEKAAEIAKAEREVADTLAEQRAEREAIVKAYRDTAVLVEKQLADERRKLDLRERLMDAEDSGELREIVQLEAQRAEIMRAHEETLENLIRQRLAASDPDEIKIAEEAIRQHYRSTAIDLEENLRRMIAASEEAAEERLETQKDLTKELNDLEEQQTEWTIEQIRRRRKEREQEAKEVREFIASIRQDLMEGQNPGRKGITDMFKRFSDAIGKAQNKQDLDELAKLFPQRINQMFSAEQEKATELHNRIMQGRQDAVQAMREGDRNRYQRTIKDMSEAQKDLAELMSSAQDRRQFAGGLQGQLTQMIQQRQRELEQIAKTKKEEDRIIQDAVTAKRKELEATNKALTAEQLRTAELRKQLALIEQMQAARALEGATTPEAKERAIRAMAGAKQRLAAVESQQITIPPDRGQSKPSAGLIPPPAPGFAEGFPDRQIVKVTPTRKPGTTPPQPIVTPQPMQEQPTEELSPRQQILQQRREAAEKRKQYLQFQRENRTLSPMERQQKWIDLQNPAPVVPEPIGPGPGVEAMMRSSQQQQQPAGVPGADDAVSGISGMGTAAATGLTMAGQGLQTIAKAASEAERKIKDGQSAIEEANRRAEDILRSYT